MADADSTAPNSTTFDQFYQLRSLAMSADALMAEAADSDEALAVGHVLRILMDKAEEFAALYAHPMNGGRHA
jgi:hypothetical protein